MSTELYYLQDTRGVVGNSALWWAKNRNGYTCDLNKAHVFTMKEAYDQHRSRPTDLPWPVSVVDPKAQRHADVQWMHRDRFPEPAREEGEG